MLYTILSVLVCGAVVVGVSLLAVLSVPAAYALAAWWTRAERWKAARRAKLGGPTLAFFHPYCNAAGGGERVLWVAVRALLHEYPTARLVIYTVESAGRDAVLQRARERFNVSLGAAAERLQLLRLPGERLLRPDTYPVLTILGQSLGGALLAFLALLRLNPDVFVDTTGCAFTYPVFSWCARARVVAYVHYPAVTRAMTRRVRAAAGTNPLRAQLKILYYRLYGLMYAWAGRHCELVLVNGSWTEEHIRELWRVPERTHLLFPPCEVERLRELRPLWRDTEPVRILAVAQFRPEKDHPLMLQALYELRELLRHDEPTWAKVRLVLAGGCRDAADAERARNLRDLAAHLALDDCVTFRTDLSYGELLQLYQTCAVGLHAMWNEHFGISVVEMMAAGLVVVAHDSGGPRADIVSPGRTGFLASEPAQYARALLQAITLSTQQRQDMVRAARASVERFSEAQFERGLLAALDPLLSA